MAEVPPPKRLARFSNPDEEEAFMAWYSNTFKAKGWPSRPSLAPEDARQAFLDEQDAAVYEDDAEPGNIYNPGGRALKTSPEPWEVASAQTTPEVMSDGTTAEPTSEPAERPEPEPVKEATPGAPTLEEFIAANKDANPDYSEEEMARIYEGTYGERGSHLPTFKEFLAANKEANPDYTDEEMKGFWQEQYGSRGALEEAPGIGSTLVEGIKGTGRSLKAFAGTLFGSDETITDAAQASGEAAAVRDPHLARLMREIDQRKQTLGPDASWFDTGAAVGAALMNNPTGALHLMTEQLPNSAAALGAAGAGFAVAGPIGALAGLFLANVSLETGGKAIEAGAKGEIDRAEILKEGGIKGSIISAVDALSFGGTKWLTGTANRALEAATARTLTASGVDVTDKAAVLAARQDPAIAAKVLDAQKAAVESVNTFGQRVTRGTAELGLESIGEGVGEYLGELAATGQADKAEAFIEAFAGMGQSVAEIGASTLLNKREAPAVDPVKKAGDETDAKNADTTKRIFEKPTVDESIKEAGKIIEEPPIKPGDIDDFIDEQNGTKKTYNESQHNVDQLAFESVFRNVGPDKGVERGQDGVLRLKGAPLRVINPDTLPETPTPIGQGRASRTLLSKGQYEALSVALGAMGKRLVVYEAGVGFEGVVNRGSQPDVVFIANNLSSSPAAVAFHEAGHLMQGTDLYVAFQQVVVENLRRDGLNAARRRHGRGFQPDRQKGETLEQYKQRTAVHLIHEMSADITGEAMSDPRFMQKVFDRLQEQVGEQRAHETAQTFLDQIKSAILRIKEAILGHRFRTPDGKLAVNQYVKNLEKVHDALAKAIADQYLKKGQVQTSTQPSPDITFMSQEENARREGEERIILPRDVIDSFKAAGDQQRGEPEMRMLEVQKASGGGVLNPVVEHVGDIIHRMTHMAEHGTALQENVKEKVDRGLKYLTHAYGFEREMKENLANNYKGMDGAAFEQKLHAALAKYADEHRKIPVYNYPQWLAKQASVAIGERQWKRATQLLQELKKLADSKEFTREAFKYERDSAGNLKPYLHPINAALVAQTPSGKLRMNPLAEDQEFHLVDGTFHLPSGTKATQKELQALGYRAVPDNVITREEDRQRRRAVEKGEEYKPTGRVSEVGEGEAGLTTRGEKGGSDRSLPHQTSVDKAASDVNLSPTDAQIEAGNYKKGHITIDGLEISIENPAGSERSGVDPDGKAWTSTMTAHYGYILGTTGHDKEHVDVFVQPGLTEDYTGPVFVVAQNNPKTGAFDEHKVVIGPATKEAARELYLSNYAKDWKGYGSIKKFSMKEFKLWLKANATFKPVPKATPAEIENAKEILAPQMSADVTETPAFKKWFGKSKVVNPDGSPKVMYHGSTEDFKEFDKSKIRPVDYDAEFNGFWFTDDPETGPAFRKADFTKAVYIKMENPAPEKVWRPLQKEVTKRYAELQGRGARSDHDGLRMLLQEKGYDGIYFEKPPALDLAKLEREGSVSFTDARGREFKLKKETEWPFGYGLYDSYEYDMHITGYETPEQFLEQQETTLVVFEPTQIKSALANTTFDPTNPNIEMSVDPGVPSVPELSPAPMFISTVVKILDLKMPNRATADQVRGILSPNNGVKPEELKWMGMDDFLKSKESFTKQEVMDYVRANQLQIKEIIKPDSVYIEDLERQMDEIGDKYAEPVETAFRKYDALKKRWKAETAVRETPYRDAIRDALMSDQAIAKEMENWFAEYDTYDPDDHFQIAVENELFELAKHGRTKLIDHDEFERMTGRRLVTDKELAHLQEEYKQNSKRAKEHYDSAEYLQLKREYDAAEKAYNKITRERENALEPLRAKIRDNNMQFKKYQLPGGEKYRELLFQLPPKADESYTVVRHPEREGYALQKPDGSYALSGPESTKPGSILLWDTKEYAEKYGIRAHNPGFTAGHWDEENILAHTRFNDRVVDGKKVLFIEEIQSDWHQKGRKEGYHGVLSDAERKELDYLNNLWAQYEERKRDQNLSDDEAYAHELTDQQIDRLSYLRNREKGLEGVPDAPFKKTWHEYVLRRMLRYAAEHGYDAIGWTTGEQQNERYDLSKQVQGIGYAKEPNGKYALTYLPNGEDKWRPLVRPLDQENYYKEEELEGVVGKELAKKIIAGEGEDFVPAKEKVYKGLYGLDLKVGGEGMKGFYDKIIPDYLNKYGKKWGGRVDSMNLTKKGEFATIDGEPLDAEVTEVHGFTLPDRMKQSVMEEGQPLFAPDMSDRAIPTPYDVEPPGLLDKIIRVMQDKNIDIKRVVEAIKRTGARIADDLNPVLKEEMYQKRAEQRSTDFMNDEMKPLIERMRLEKVSLEELDKYLHARHVINDQLNSRLRDMNPDMDNNEALSGMTDEEANRILASYTGRRGEVMQDVARRVDAIVEKTRDMMVDYGLEKASTIASWRQLYTSYVPLRREGFDEAGHPTGTGRSVRGSTAQDRLGSNLAVENILGNIAQARDQVITRGEKMRPVVAFAGLLMQHPNKNLARLDRPATITVTDPTTGLTTTVPGDLGQYKVPMIRRFDPVRGEVRSIPDPLYKGRPNVVNFRVKGQDYAIIFNEKDERAMEVAKAFKELDVAKLNGVLQAVAPFTRYLAAINTQYNPIFGIVNFIRDAQFAMLTLADTPIAGKQLEVLNNARKSLVGIYQDARDARHGLHPQSATAQLWERFQHVGGPTGYRDLFFTASDRAKEIERLLNPTTFKNRVAGIGDSALFRLLSDYNLTMENAIRLGVFKTAVESGMSDLQAASLAKNITVNFNKKGQIGAQMGSLYAFFNASVQGTARILETVGERTPDGGFRLSPAGKKIVVGGLLVGVLQTFMLALGGFDEDEPPEYIKDRNLVIPAPGTDKGYVTIPMPLGFNLLPNIGRVAAEAVQAGFAGRPPKLMEKSFALMGAFLNAFSPTGGTGDLLTELSPTVIDPIVALKTNRDWTGKPISKEDMSSLKPTPGHTRARDTATVWAMAMSKAINWATGGTDYTPGMMSPTPDAIDYLIQQATGGVGREISKFAQVSRSAYTGEEVPLYKVPLVGRFAGSASGSAATREHFYDNIRAVNLAAEEAKGRALHHEDLSSYLKQNPEGRFEKAAISVERTIAKLNRQKQDMISKGSSRGEIRLKEQQIIGLMDRFNAVIEEARKR